MLSTTIFVGDSAEVDLYSKKSVTVRLVYLVFADLKQIDTLVPSEAVQIHQEEYPPCHNITQ